MIFQQNLFFLKTQNEYCLNIYQNIEYGPLYGFDLNRGAADTAKPIPALKGHF